MDNVIFEAVKQRLRFNVGGNISTEDLFTVNYDLLSQYEESLKTEVESFGKSRRGSTNTNATQERTKLRLAVVSVILDYRDAEKERINSERENREHNQKILGLIAQKQEKALTELSVEELEKLLKK